MKQSINEPKSTRRPPAGKSREAGPPPSGTWFANGLILINFLTAGLIAVVMFLPAGLLRSVLVVPFLLLFPGYALMAAIFPKKGTIDTVERIVLSVVLSLVIDALIGLVLNYTPWGIRLEPVMYALVAFLFLASTVAWIREAGLESSERFGFNFSLHWPAWESSREDRLVTIILVIAILGACSGVAYALINPGAGEKYTEFYILGQNGLAGDYPNALQVGEEGRVLIGVINHERTPVNYSIEVVMDGSKADEAGPVALADGQDWEGDVGFTAARPGENKKVEFILFRDGDATPYKELHLLIDVTE